MNAHALTALNASPDDFLRSVAANAIRAAMEVHGHVLLTASDAKRMDLIFKLLHLDQHDLEPLAEGQVVALAQPEVHPALHGIEEKMAELFEQRRIEKENME